MDSLYRHKSLWDHKPVLREIYLHYYRLIAQFAKGGRSLEIGGGSGNFKEFYPDVITTDIVFTPWADVIADAHQLPFRPSSFENLILIDVLHHLENPCTFIDEARRILRPNGRVIMIEPCISLFSAPFYDWFHPEPVDMNADPFVVVQPDKHRRPFDANQAIPTLMFLKRRRKFEMKYDDLAIVHIDRFDFLAYPLSGGFRSWSLIPSAWVAPLKKMETLAPSFGKNFFAFRLIVVLQKR
jgi:SAM-dependent methyltransferase